MKYYSISDFLKECNGHCYIYGAGVYGYYIAKHIITNYDNQITIDSIFVSSMEGNYNNIFGIPVRLIDEIEITQDINIIIAISEKYAMEIEDMLRAKGITNIYVISDMEYRVIRRETPDVLPEIRQDIKYYMSRCLNEQKSSTAQLRRDISQLKELDIDIFKLDRDIFQLEKYLVKIAEYQKFLIDSQSHIYRGRSWDEKRYRNEFEGIAKSPDLLKEKIKKLVYGLDSDSVFEVYRIIDRLHRLVEDKPIIFTDEESNVLKKMEEEFYQKVFKITEELYCYKNYYLPKEHFEAGVFWDEHGIRLLESLEYIRGKDVIDAGGYIADSALILSKYTNGKVYSFEAEKENYELMKKTIEMNNVTNIVPVNAALTDKVGMLEFHVGNDVANMAGSLQEGFKATGVGVETVEGTTIDEYVKEHKLNVGLIKTDVEGAESLLLKGAIETIKTQKPTMLISIYHNMSDFFEIKPWIENLNLGYRFKIYRPINKRTFLEETVLICEVMDNSYT